MKSNMAETKRPRDRWVYLLGVFLGICAGILDLEAGDLLGTALFVLISTMVLGVIRPERPWRWTIMVGVFVPLVRLGAYLWVRQKSDRAQIYESILGFVTGFAGAYSGSVARRGVRELFGK
jgi:energy-converting hydrogenase Eha subunit A